MKNGLAIWHYPHRSIFQNVAYFADCGFESVSILGSDMEWICGDSTRSRQLAELIEERGIVLTIHHKLPRSHSDEDISNFKASIDRFAEWQRSFSLLSILSFDVPQTVRDNAAGYIEYALKNVPYCKIAAEDFGLTKEERNQIEHLKTNKRFGYLVDIGHMYIRLCGKYTGEGTLLANSPDECPAGGTPGYAEFLRAFASKEFPVFEVHLHNNDGIRDMHYFLDNGTLDIRIIAEVLKDIGFNGVLTIESAPGYAFECKYPESDKRINETYKLWKELIR